MKTITVTFEKGIQSVHIPFTPDIGSYDQLYKQMERVAVPKNARRIEASLVVSVDLAKGQTSYQLAEVTVHK